MELNEQEAHCIARRLQCAKFAYDSYIGCRFCRHPCDKTKKESTCRIADKKLAETTGVDLSGVYKGVLRPTNLDDKPLKVMDFPYKTFLVGASEETKSFYREFFNDI